MNTATISYLELVNADTIISEHPKSPKWIGYWLWLLVIALLSGISSFGYLYNKKPVVPALCTESIYVLREGQSATCHDPRSRIDVIGNTANDVTFMCKCND